MKSGFQKSGFSTFINPRIWLSLVQTLRYDRDTTGDYNLCIFLKIFISISTQMTLLTFGVGGVGDFEMQTNNERLKVFSAYLLSPRCLRTSQANGIPSSPGRSRFTRHTSGVYVNEQSSENIIRKWDQWMFTQNTCSIVLPKIGDGLTLRVKNFFTSVYRFAPNIENAGRRSRSVESNLTLLSLPQQPCLPRGMCVLIEWSAAFFVQTSVV